MQFPTQIPLKSHESGEALNEKWCRCCYIIFYCRPYAKCCTIGHSSSRGLFSPSEAVPQQKLKPWYLESTRFANLSQPSITYRHGRLRARNQAESSIVNPQEETFFSLANSTSLLRLASGLVDPQGGKPSEHPSALLLE